MWMRRAKPPGNERYPVIRSCLLLDAAAMPSVRPDTPDASAVRWYAPAPRRAEMHTRQWVGTYAGRGNGDYRGELASVLEAITTYLRQFTFTAAMALVRLDGEYGDAAVMAETHSRRRVPCGT